MDENDLRKTRFEQEKFDLDKFKLLREEIRYEYNITALRVAWYLTSQSFFVLSFAGAVAKLSEANSSINPHDLYIFCIGVNILGILLSVSVLLVIRMSFIRIWELHEAIGNSVDTYDSLPIEHYSQSRRDFSSKSGCNPIEFLKNLLIKVFEYLLSFVKGKIRWFCKKLGMRLSIRSSYRLKPHFFPFVHRRRTKLAMSYVWATPSIMAIFWLFIGYFITQNYICLVVANFSKP